MKKILAFTLALAMVLATWTPTFAASKEVEALANLKLLLNTTDKEVNADLTRAVGLAMVLKALGYTQEDADAKMAENTFVDLDKAAWAKGFAKLGEDLKITNGTSVEPKKFSPNWKLNERAFVAFMLRALGYNVDEAWAKAGELAKEAMIAETVSENKLTKGEAAVIMYKALKAKVVGDEKGRTLAEKLVADKKLDKELAVANGLISAEPEKLTVSAMADNLKEITVMFDGTVDKKTAEKKENYRVKNYTVNKAKVLDDEKTVVLTVNNSLANKREFELTVSNVKNAAGNVMDKQTVKFTTNDVTAPVFEGITVTGPKNFEIKYSEPMNNKGTIAVKHGKNSSLSVRATEYDEARRVLKVTLGQEFKDGKEYVVVIGNGKKNTDYPTDFAGYTTTYHEEQLTYTKDTTVPEVKVVDANQKTVTLEFTKPVTGLDPKFFSHTFSSYHPVKLLQEDGEKALESGHSYSKVVLVFHDDKLTGNDAKEKNRALPAGEVKIMVMGKIGSSKIEDNWKNQLADTELMVTVTADRELPEVVSAEVKSADTVEVTFSETIMDKDWKKDYTIQLLDKDGKVVEKTENVVSFVKNTENNKVYTIKFRNSYVGKTMTLVIKGVKDTSLYANVMADYSTELVFNDKVFSLEKTKVELKRTGTKAEEYRFFVYITYDEEMDDSVLDLTNYKVRDDANVETAVKGTAEFLDGDRKIVSIELDYNHENVDMKGAVVKLFENYNQASPSVKADVKVLIKGDVKDLAGNKDGRFEKEIAAPNLKMLNSADFKIEKAKAVAKDKVEVELSRDVVEMDNFEKYWTIAGHEVEEVTLKDNKVIVLTIKDGSLPADPSLLTVKYDTVVNVQSVNITSDIKDIFGNPLTAAASVKIEDKIKPGVQKVVKEDNSQNTTEILAFQKGKSTADFDGKERILVAFDKTSAGQNVPSTTLKKLTATVYVIFDEDVTNASLSNTIFTVSNGWAVSKAETIDSQHVKDKVVAITIEKAFDGYAPNQYESKVKPELNDLTLTQVGAVRDNAGNTLSGNNTAVNTFFFDEAANLQTDVLDGIE